MATGSFAFMPHGYCLTWNPWLVGEYVVADAIIGLAYYSIPLTLIYFIRRNRGLGFGWLFWMFSLFIFACGTGHFIDIVNIWWPHYELQASIKAVTAAVSIATALAAWPMLPKVSAMIEFNRRASQALQQSNTALLQSEERIRLILKHAPIGLAIVSLEGRFVSVNHTLCEMLDYSEPELLARTFQDITHPDDLGADLAHVQELIDGVRDSYRMEKRYFHRSGQLVYVQLDVSVLRDSQARPIHFISQIQDISDRVEQQRSLERRAMIDDLTGLPNRRSFLEELERVASRAARLQQPVALLMIDLDHFKQINDAFGHASGDRVLRAMREIVLPKLRGGDMLARLGGEEFAALLPNTGVDAALPVAERIRQAIADTGLQSVDGLPVQVTASIGVMAFIGQHDLARALEYADRALYAAKRSGRNQVVRAPLLVDGWPSDLPLSSFRGEPL